MEIKNINKWWEVSKEDEKEVIHQVKKILFPKAEDSDWEILKLWFESNDKKGEMLPLSNALHLAGDLNFDVAEFCQKFKNRPVRLDIVNPDNKQIQIDKNYKIFIYENLYSVRISFEWYPFLRRAVLFDGQSKFVFDPIDLNKLLVHLGYQSRHVFSALFFQPLIETGLIQQYQDKGNTLYRVFNQIDVTSPEKWVDSYFFSQFPSLDFLINQNVQIVLETLKKEPLDKFLNGLELENKTGLTTEEINMAVDHLEQMELIERINSKSTEPYNFATISLNSKGRFYLREKSQNQARSILESQDEQGSILNHFENVDFSQPYFPAGSPYGFTDQDWEYVSKKKKQYNVLYVVLGLQWKSQIYNTENLKANIRGEFERVVRSYNEKSDKSKIELDFSLLKAGYGEHLFNHIAREIISADIAVFETSDINPNVMIELGVALTWGVRVLPIKKIGTEMPSDISGQTWAEYAVDGTEFTNKEHYEDMLYMIERAIQKKVRNT